jgi:soluble cytochrome b562
MKQAVYVLGALFLALIILSAIPGCANPVTVPQSPQEAINEANITLTAAANVIASNVRDKVFTREEGQQYIDKVRDLAKKVDDAQKLVDSGLPDAAKQAEIVRSLILALHREVAARARKS